jgi:hypothetical protein
MYKLRKRKSLQLVCPSLTFSPNSEYSTGIVIELWSGCGKKQELHILVGVDWEDNPEVTINLINKPDKE